MRTLQMVLNCWQRRDKTTYVSLWWWKRWSVESVNAKHIDFDVATINQDVYDTCRSIPNLKGIPSLWTAHIKDAKNQNRSVMCWSVQLQQYCERSAHTYVLNWFEWTWVLPRSFLKKDHFCESAEFVRRHAGKRVWYKDTYLSSASWTNCRR